MQNPEKPTTEDLNNTVPLSEQPTTEDLNNTVPLPEQPVTDSTLDTTTINKDQPVTTSQPTETVTLSPSITTRTSNVDVLSGKTGLSDSAKRDTSLNSLTDKEEAIEEDKRDKAEADDEILGDKKRAEGSKEQLNETNKDIDEKKRLDEEKRNAEMLAVQNSSLLQTPPEIQASKNINTGNSRPANNEDKEEIKQKAKDDERKESKFVKYGRVAGWTALDMITGSLGITSRKTGLPITASLIRDFVVAGKKDKAELQPVFDFLKNQKPPFERVGREDGYDKDGKPMSTWIFQGGDPKTNISVSRDTIGASNPESKEFFLKCLEQFAEAKNRVEDKGKPGKEKINLHISGDKEAITDLKKMIDDEPIKNSKFKNMDGLPKPQVDTPQTPQIGTHRQAPSQGIR